MKNALAASCSAILSLAFAANAFAHDLKFPVSVEGQAKNTTVNLPGTVAFEITKQGNCYKAKGEYGGKVFGRFDLTGKLVSHTATDHVYKFDGDLDFSNLGGWPAGTKGKYEMTVTLKQNGPATGSYHIWPFKGLQKPLHQYGTLDMTWSGY